MATNPRESTTDVGKETRRTADQSAHTVHSMTDATERAARIGSDSARRNAESAEAMWRDGTEAASRIAQRSMDQLSRMMGLSGEAARESAKKTSGICRRYCKVPLILLVDCKTLRASGCGPLKDKWSTI